MKPEDVLHNWDLLDNNTTIKFTITKTETGLLNNTYLIRNSNNDLYILQRVHPAVSMNGSMNNYFHVTQFFINEGVPSQQLLRTKSGEFWIDDTSDGWRWRLLKGVEGKTYTKTQNSELAREAGRYLGKFHNILSKYPNELEIGRLSHRYENQVDKLNQYIEQIRDVDDEQIREAGILIHNALPKLLLPTDLPISIIHADPKISNFVFNDQGQVVCMIDLDTIQKLSPLFEIADAARSWCGGDEDDLNNTFNQSVYRSLLNGYFDTSKELISEREIKLIPQACQLVMIGLASRFLVDYIEDKYFGWDATKYNSRKDHNRARTLGQLSLYQSFIKSI